MIRDFVPGLYRDNQELNAIVDAVQPELDFIFAELRDRFDDTFPIVATLYGVERWEILLGIVANPSVEGLQFRRERILNRLASNIPFTERMLQQVMNNIMGENGWSYELDYRNYQLDITSLRPGRNWLNEMRITLEKIIPANLMWFLHMYYQMWRTPYDNGFTWQDGYERYATWQDALEGIEIE